VTEPAPLGCYIHGLVLEGARWDRDEGRLRDSLPGELRQQMPVILVGPTGGGGQGAPRPAACWPASS
jgi:dynein heavy chain